MRRSEHFRRERTRKRKKLLSATLCVCVCAAVVAVLPFPAAKNDCAAPEANMLLMDDMKTESAMVQQMEPAEAAPAERVTDECVSEGTAEVTVRCGDEEITLDEEEAAVILEYFASGEWIMSAANCLCDYTIYVDGAVYRYHSDCGTIQDEMGQSMNLSVSDRHIFNEIISRCPMPIE